MVSTKLSYNNDIVQTVFFNRLCDSLQLAVRLKMQKSNNLRGAIFTEKGTTITKFPIFSIQNSQYFQFSRRAHQIIMSTKTRGHLHFDTPSCLGQSRGRRSSCRLKWRHRPHILGSGYYGFNRLIGATLHTVLSSVCVLCDSQHQQKQRGYFVTLFCKGAIKRTKNSNFLLQ